MGLWICSVSRMTVAKLVGFCLKGSEYKSGPFFRMQHSPQRPLISHLQGRGLAELSSTNANTRAAYPVLRRGQHCKGPEKSSNCGYTHQLKLAPLRGFRFIFFQDAKHWLFGVFVVSCFALHVIVFIGKHGLLGKHWWAIVRAFKALLVLWVFALEWVRFSSPCKREVAHSAVNFANNRAKCRAAAAPLGAFVLLADLEEKTMKVSLICLSSLQQSDAFCHLYW